MKSRIDHPTNTCGPRGPGRQQKIVATAPSFSAKPTREYSIPWVTRNDRPIRNVSRRPARSPHTFPRFTDWSAQCIVNDDVTRMHVFTNATKIGRWNGGVGHAVPATTRTKKYAVKKEPKSMIS